MECRTLRIGGALPTAGIRYSQVSYLIRFLQLHALLSLLMHSYAHQFLIDILKQMLNICFFVAQDLNLSYQSTVQTQCTSASLLPRLSSPSARLWAWQGLAISCRTLSLRLCFEKSHKVSKVSQSIFNKHFKTVRNSRLNIHTTSTTILPFSSPIR